MAPPTATASSNSTPTTTPPRLPPDEQFWQRYSPHHEFPLSSVISAGLHIVVVALLLLAAWVALYFVNQANKPLPVEAVEYDRGGGGGNARGVGDLPGKNSAAPLPEDTGNQQENPNPTPPEVKFNDLKVGDVDPLQVAIKDESGQTAVAVSDDVRQRLESLNQDIRKQLTKGLAPAKGESGSGTGGGNGTGHGKANGPGTGDAKGKLDRRTKRVLRWSMIFNTESGEDYLRQLANIKPGGGAILAVPQPPNGTSFMVLRDLHKRPATGAVEDISKIHRIYWVDDKPESVAGLARALGLPAVPPYIVAFFPEELEQQLAKLEHDHKGLGEDEIEETKFSVVHSPDGSYHAQVLSQMPKQH